MLHIEKKQWQRGDISRVLSKLATEAPINLKRRIPAASLESTK